MPIARWYGASAPAASALVVTLTLAGLSAACARDREPPPEGFVDVVDTIGRLCVGTSNTFECARTVEQHRLARGVPGVTRVGRRLSIAVANGTVVDLTDGRDPSAEDYEAFTYLEHLGCVGYHLVHRQLAESGDYLLVHAAAGSRLRIPGVPVLAPDCGRLAVVAGSPAADSLLQVWRLTDTRQLVIEWGYQPEAPWTVGVPVWRDATRLDLPYTLDDDPQTRRTLRARLYTDGWRLEP